MPLKTEILQHQLTRSEEWGKNADVKIGAILAFDGVAMLTIAKRALANVVNAATPKLIVAACLIALVLLAWSLGKALWGIIPRLKHRQGQSSPLYYYDVKELTLTNYKQKIRGLTERQYKDEVVHQIHAMANVVTRKMVSFRDSVLLLAASLALMGGVELWLRLQTLVKG